MSGIPKPWQLAPRQSKKPPSSCDLRLASRIAWYSDVSGAPWLGRVERRLAPEVADAEDTPPLPLPVGVLGVLTRRGGDDRHREHRHHQRDFQRQGADCASIKHCCPPLCSPLLAA